MTQSGEIIIFGTSDNFGLLDEPHLTRLPVNELRKNLEAFMRSLEDILPSIDRASAGFELKEVEVAVGVNGKGQVGFLGTGAEVGGTATIKVAFRR